MEIEAKNKPGPKKKHAPKKWWYEKEAEVREGNPSYSDEQVRATVGSIWWNLDSGKRKEIKERYYGKKKSFTELSSQLVKIASKL